ncbi:hypothetical protein Q7O_002367 [Pectobacterium carotovorum subsp. carotovorum PCCS1]|nr:hypothetical protein [Pectobacterium carotovorum subsp. carotovorum PCCS1]
MKPCAISVGGDSVALAFSSHEPSLFFPSFSEKTHQKVSELRMSFGKLWLFMP